ncbi:hypothetical protein CR513_01607, partial [Mucuna pruriens]
MIQLEKQAALCHPISLGTKNKLQRRRRTYRNLSQSLDSHSCETVATDPAYQSSAAYSNGTKPRLGKLGCPYSQQVAGRDRETLAGRPARGLPAIGNGITRRGVGETRLRAG